jgi:hypothetical protein
MSNPMWFITPAVVIVLYVLKTSGRNQMASRRGSALVFGPSRAMTLLVMAAIALGGALIAGPILQTGRIDIATSIIGGGILIAGLILIPPVVILCNQGVEARWWWGRRNSLSWSSITGASYDRTKKEMSLHGQAGAVLRHTQYHVDPLRFQMEIERHVGRIGEIRQNPSELNSLDL